MQLNEIDNNILIATYDNFCLICNTYHPTHYYYLGYDENNKTTFTQGLPLVTSPTAFKDILNDNDYNGIGAISKNRQKNQKEKDLLFLHSQIESRTNGNAENILFELLTPLGDMQELLNSNDKTITDELDYLKNITNETVISKIQELSDEITKEKNSTLCLANAGRKGKIVQFINNPAHKDGLYYETEYKDEKTGKLYNKYELIGNLLIHELTLIYDKLKLFDPVATIEYTNTTTNQVVTLEKQPYEAIANNLVNNRLIDSNNLGVESLLNKIWVQGVNNIDFITAETDLLKDGFFMDMENKRVLSNNVFENLETSSKEVKNAIKLVEGLLKGRGTAVPNDCTLFRFMLWSPFAYCLKQLGYTDGLYSMVLWGVTDTNKTGSSVMFSNLYTNKTTTLQKANTQSAIGTRLGENTFPLILDEAKDNLTNPNDEEFNKNIVTDEMGRAVKDRTNNNLMVEFPALRLTVRTLNQDIEYKDEFLKRHKVLYYDSAMQVKEADKIDFNKKYKPNSPATPLHQLRHLGKAFADRFIPYLESESDELYDLENLTVTILKQIGEDYNISIPYNLITIQKLTNQSRDTASIIKTGLNRIFRKAYPLLYNHNGYMETDFTKAVDLGAINWLDYQPKNDLFIIKVNEFEKEISDIVGQHIPIAETMELLGIDYEYKERAKFKGGSFPCIRLNTYNLTYKLFDINIYDKDEWEQWENNQKSDSEKLLELQKERDNHLKLKNKLDKQIKELEKQIKVSNAKKKQREAEADKIMNAEPI